MSFFNELKRRNVIRVGIAYVIVAWLILQFADVVLNNIEAPGWVFQVIMLVLGIGLPLALFFAWAFEMTPEGIKKEKDVDRSQSITPQTGKKLNNTILVLMALGIGYLLFDKFSGQAQPGTDHFSQQTSSQTADTNEKSALSPVEAQAGNKAEPSIAVLPFINMSTDPEQEYFSDGISEELLNLLVKVKGLKVASRTSSFTYKGSSLGLAEIAGELGVDHVLEGSVRKADNRVRITAQLIDASTDRHLWSDAFDRELVDIFAIQDEIANAIVTALSTELGILQDTPAISVATATENLDAYDIYLKARGLFLIRKELEESIALYERAVELDPDFVRAWEGLAAVYAIVESWDIFGRDWDKLAIQAAKRALELDPNLAMPWAVMGFVASNAGDSVTGMPYMNRAIELDPGNATNYLWRALDYSTLGFQAEAITDLKRCLEIDPAYSICRSFLAISYEIINEDELARLHFTKSVEQGFPGAQINFIQRFMSWGERLMTTLILLNIVDKDPSFPMTATLDALEFPERDHSRGLEKMLTWLDKPENMNYQSVFLAVFGAYELVEPNRSQNRWVWLKENAGFRASKYFAPYMKKVGTPAYWRKNGFPTGCRPVGEEDFECD